MKEYIAKEDQPKQLNIANFYDSIISWAKHNQQERQAQNMRFNDSMEEDPEAKIQIHDQSNQIFAEQKDQLLKNRSKYQELLNSGKVKDAQKI